MIEAVENGVRRKSSAWTRSARTRAPRRDAAHGGGGAAPAVENGARPTPGKSHQEPDVVRPGGGGAERHARRRSSQSARVPEDDHGAPGAAVRSARARHERASGSRQRGGDCGETPRGGAAGCAACAPRRGRARRRWTARVYDAEVAAQRESLSFTLGSMGGVMAPTASMDSSMFDAKAPAPEEVLAPAPSQSRAVRTAWMPGVPPSPAAVGHAGARGAQSRADESPCSSRRTIRTRGR